MEHKGTFLGRRMAQSKKAIWLWEQLLSSIRFSRIIDIGTYNGNFSLYLSLFCEERDAEFYTIDIANFVTPKQIRKYQRLWDVFEHEEEMKNMIVGPGITILFCDGGDKPREVFMFSKYLKKDDILVVHDWGTEIFQDNIPKEFKPIMEEECQEEGYLKIFKKI